MAPLALDSLIHCRRPEKKTKGMTLLAPLFRSGGGGFLIYIQIGMKEFPSYLEGENGGEKRERGSGPNQWVAKSEEG